MGGSLGSSDSMGKLKSTNRLRFIDYPFFSLPNSVFSKIATSRQSPILTGRVSLIFFEAINSIFQKLHLCDYLRELYEAAEDENEHGAGKKKDFSRHAPKECE